MLHFSEWQAYRRGVGRAGVLTRGLIVVACLTAVAGLAKPRFLSSEIGGPGSELILCDLDGDQLKDAVLIDGSSLSIFYQDPIAGFARKPSQNYELETPCVIWPANLGQTAESLLMLTRDGVSELVFTNRTAAPSCRQIICERTIVPEAVEKPSAVYLPLSARTGGNWPLIVVPTFEGLQVWGFQEGWRVRQVLKPASLQAQFMVFKIGFNREFELSLALNDLNGDQRDDLIVRTSNPDGSHTFHLYLQHSDGSFGEHPDSIRTVHSDSRSWFCWVDLNGDHNVDLLQGTWLGEPWFIPGTRSGKVLISTYLAGPDGQISTKPEQVFRKNDWTASLPVVDIDGDGALDLVLGYSLFDSREGVRKMITAKQLDLNLKLHFYRPGAGFAPEPDCQRDIVIHLDAHSLLLSWSRREYFERFVNLSGDFDGDGKKDLLVRGHPDYLSVYRFISRERGFSAQPDFKFTCAESYEWMRIQDLNHDGVSDLILKLQKRPAYLVFTSAPP